MMHSVTVFLQDFAPHEVSCANAHAIENLNIIDVLRARISA